MVVGIGTLFEGLQAVGMAELANMAGLFVALVGIGFTLGQLVLLRRQLKLDALIRILDSNRAIVALGVEHPAVWSVLEGETPAADARSQRHYLQLWVNQMLIIWMAWRLGLVSGLEWAAYSEDMSEFLHTPSLQTHWARVSRFYPSGFQRLISELLPSRPPEPVPARGPSGEDRGLFVRHNPRKP